MKTLFVSYDCGLSYGKLMQSESVDELLKRTERRENPLEDISWCRWYIEDDAGEMDMEHISPIHKSILNFLKRANEKADAKESHD